MIELNKPVNPDLKTLTKYLERVNESGWYTNFGPLHQELTERLKKYLGVENLLLVSNGTLALQVACKALGVKSVLTTPFSFVATSSSVLWQDMKLSFSDIDEESFNLSFDGACEALSLDTDIDGIIATHVFGNPCDINNFQRLSEDKGIKIIYDAAHAFDIKVNGDSVLNFGDASTLSFHATKVFHTVEGGAIVFKDKKQYEKAKRLINFGMDENGDIKEIGINAKLNEYQCAVGLTILDKIDGIVSHRSMLYRAYKDALKDLVIFPKWHKLASTNGSYMPIYINNDYDVEKIIEELSRNGIQSRRYFSPSLDDVFENVHSFGTVKSQIIAKGILCLPLHYYMTLSDVEKVSDTIKGAMK